MFCTGYLPFTVPLGHSENKMYVTQAVLKRSSGCWDIVSFHRSLNLALAQRKLHNVFIFGVLDTGTLIFDTIPCNRMSKSSTIVISNPAWRVIEAKAFTSDTYCENKQVGPTPGGRGGGGANECNMTRDANFLRIFTTCLAKITKQ